LRKFVDLPCSCGFRFFPFAFTSKGVAMRRVIDSLLLVVAVVGGYLAWQTGRERILLAQHYRRLARAAGDIVVVDPSKIHVHALDTGEPLHFAWRVFLPANYAQVWHATTGGAGNTRRAKQTEFIARVRLRPDDQGKMQIYARTNMAASLASLGSDALNDLLRGRWNKLKAEQLGATGTAVIDPSEKAVFLRLTLPDDLADEARRKLPPQEQKRYFPLVFELALGPASSSATTSWTPSSPLRGAGAK
jgi:hypothetical protein